LSSPGPRCLPSVPLDAHPSTINLPILYIIWQTRDGSLQDYLREARANGVAFVPTEKRKPVIDWLKGEGLEGASSSKRRGRQGALADLVRRPLLC
jgi:hypothetical protein